MVITPSRSAVILEALYYRSFPRQEDGQWLESSRLKRRDFVQFKDVIPANRIYHEHQIWHQFLRLLTLPTQGMPLISIYFIKRSSMANLAPRTPKSKYRTPPAQLPRFRYLELIAHCPTPRSYLFPASSYRHKIPQLLDCHQMFNCSTSADLIKGLP